MAVCSSGCGSSSAQLDPKGIERAIAGAIQRQRGVSATVSCPRAVRRKGEVFDCVASPRPSGQPTYFEVTEVDAAGHVHFLGLR